jgi:hypothetical protein
MVIWVFKLIFAIASTSLGVYLSAVSAMDLGGTTDQVLLAPLFVFVTLLVHFLPALVKNKFVPFICVICLVASLFNLVSFFVHSAERADVLRETKAEDSLKVREISESIADVSREYESTDSSTETGISHLLATKSSWNVKFALKIKSAEAQRKIELSNQLATLKLERAKIRETLGIDTVTSEFSRFLHVSPITFRVSIGLLIALMVDLSGAILWNGIFNGKVVTSNNISKSEAEVIENAKVHEPIWADAPTMTSPKVKSRKNTKLATTASSEDQDVNAIILAMNDGNFRPTVISIQKYLHLRTSRAAEVNRKVKELLLQGQR